ncbi:hypothetical protein F5B22DRAFT_585712 [Xylaria bambusicola]|uniref:uncharacterized protein n=1 Tax=Xylaria bambusicola TaxID=326684 RepID=UPI0020088EA4|nr:uncharacterized protein F5B22DRAFT_585712 [Xylaria bambusicola]KAI0526428.1 hypothetical protein F5B22DRAFT_585712 [Xylaria bambusicola]
MAAIAQVPVSIPGLHVSLTIEDLKQSSLVYNLLPDDRDQPHVQEVHLQQLAVILKHYGVQNKFGIHLIHGHLQLESDKIMLGTALTSVRGCWTKPTSINHINLAEIHGHIFKLTPKGELQAYEYREGSVMDLSDVDAAFFHELTEYLKTNNLVDLLGVQVLGKEIPEMMCEFVLQDNGTVMLDSRDVKGWSPYRTTGFFYAPGMTSLSGGEKHAKKTNGNHQVFVDGKIGKEDPLMDVLRAQDIVY